MMFNFPFYSYYPHSIYKRYNSHNNWSYSNIRKSKTLTSSSHSCTSNTKVENKTRNFTDTDKEDKVFEILGIKLHFDDILLICLIFFLYNEGINDEFLFISLILLLLS